MGKGEIARYKQFLLNFFFSHCVFKMLVLQTRKNQGLFGKGLRDHCSGETPLSNQPNIEDHLLQETTFIASLGWYLNTRYTVCDAVAVYIKDQDCVFCAV